MKNKQASTDYNLSLIHAPKERDVVLAKMRGKLAGPSQFEVRTQEKHRQASRAGKMGWAWKIALAAALVAGNAAYFLTREESVVRIFVKRAPTLPMPSAGLDVNKQALYWAYAMYDFDRLKSTFGVRKNVIVDGALAAERLAALMPKVDAQTRFIISAYLPRARRST